MKKLNEGLLEGDLENLVLPLISIDEYESKLADNGEVIVIAFFCDDSLPAQDLANFLLKSPVDIIDADCSPAPNQEDYYLVFVEIPRNKKFPEKVVELVDSIKGLTKNEKWQFTPYGSDKLYDLSIENMKKKISLKKKTPKEKAKDNKIKIDMHQKLEKRKDHDDAIKAKKQAKKETKKESIQRWLQDSLLDNVILNETISFKQNGNNFDHDYLAFDTFEAIVEKLQLKSVKLDENTIWQNRPLAESLGSEYFITQMDNVLLIAKHGDNRILAVKK
jgi:hypothetical protein